MKLRDQHQWADSVAEWGWQHNFDARSGVHRREHMNTQALQAVVSNVFEEGRAKVIGAIGDSVIEAHVDSELHEFKKDLLAAVAAAEGPPQVAAEPFWHAVVSVKSPVIDKAIRRADVAEEYADRYRSEGFYDVQVVPLYRHGQAATWQQRALDAGFVYGRAPDDHWVEATVEQATALLQDVLGIRVDIASPAATSAPAEPLQVGFFDDGVLNADQLHKLWAESDHALDGKHDWMSQLAWQVASFTSRVMKAIATSAPSEPAAYARFDAEDRMLALWTVEQAERGKKEYGIELPADAEPLFRRAAPQPTPAAAQPEAGLCQDEPGHDPRELSKWFAGKPDARQLVRDAAAQPEAPAEPVAWPATSIDDLKPIGFASAMDVLTYVPSMQIGLRLPGVRDVPMYTGDQLQAAVNFERNGSVPPAAEVEERRELSEQRLREIIDEHLTAAYACTRVWEAWSVGTMAEDDFVPLRETEFVDDLTAAILAKSVELSNAARDVLAERARQISAEGWTAEHDDEYTSNELSRAAACYALGNTGHAGRGVSFWPWDVSWWRPQGQRRNLIKAGALILAEIERLDRAASKQKWSPCTQCKTPDYCANRLRGCDIAESADAGIQPLAASKEKAS